MGKSHSDDICGWNEWRHSLKLREHKILFEDILLYKCYSLLNKTFIGKTSHNLFFRVLLPSLNKFNYLGKKENVESYAFRFLL